MDDTGRPLPLLTRRSTLRAAAAAAVGLAVVGCGADSSAEAPTTGSSSDAASPPGGATGTSAPATGSGSAGATGAGAALVATTDVPVGGAKVVTAEGAGYVVAQPSAGQFVAHSAKCTHMACTVGVDKGLALQCPCHGSRYDAATGEVQRGPATRALASVTVTVSDGQVRLA